MRYMMIAYDDMKAWHAEGEEVLADAMRQAADLCHDLAAKGQYILASPLHDASTATCVRIRDGRRIVTDGPFAETREQLGGFYLLEADSAEEIVPIARRHPGMRHGGVEIRPLIDLPGLPETA